MLIATVDAGVLDTASVFVLSSLLIFDSPESTPQRESLCCRTCPAIHCCFAGAALMWCICGAREKNHSLILILDLFF